MQKTKGSKAGHVNVKKVTPMTDIRRDVPALKTGNTKSIVIDRQVTRVKSRKSR